MLHLTISKCQQLAKIILLRAIKHQIFRGKKIVIAIALSRPLLKTQLKYSNNLNHKGNRALGTGK